MSDESAFRKIPDWPNYEISQEGQVRSLTGSGFAARKLRYPRFKKAHKGKDGYWRVTLHEKRGDKRRIETWLVHRLVAISFVPGDRDLHVCHLDGNKDNNHAANLKWVTRLENESHKISHGTRASGSRNGQSKLCERSVVAIRKLVQEEKWSQTKTAKLFQVTPKNVSAIVLRKSWREI